MYIHVYSYIDISQRRAQEATLIFFKNAVVIHNREFNVIYVQFVNPEFEGVEVFLQIHL